jgi:8-oxo-dGTP pyrophosphatase MutT (NUDIX family)
MVRNLQWTLKTSEQLIKDKWADVKSNSYEKLDGSVIEPFYIYGFPDYACAVAITKEGKVILERIFRPGLNVVATELPGGCVDKSDASLEDAIARELREETGYNFEAIEYLGKVSPNPTTNTNLMHMFLATGGVFDPNQPLDVDEDVETFLITVDELVEMTQQQQFIQSMQLSCIFFALQKLGRIAVK